MRARRHRTATASADTQGTTHRGGAAPRSARPADASAAAAPHAPAHESAHEPPPVPERPPLDPASAAALRLWVVMSRAHSAISAHAASDVARHGLTLAEFGILEALYHRGPMLLGEVQRRILVSSGGITFLVDRLTAKGLVERRTCEADRRARYAALTPKGETLVGEIFPAHAAAVTRAMSGLDIDEQAVAADLLRTLGLEAASLPLPAKA